MTKTEDSIITLNKKFSKAGKESTLKKQRKNTAIILLYIYIYIYI